MSFNDTVLGFNNDTNTGTKAKKPDAVLWLNIGFTVKVPNEDGVVEDVFVSLPMGIGLDNQDDAKVGGKNTPYNQRQKARNALKAALVAKGMALEPGGEVILDPAKVQVQMRRVSTKEEVPATAETNPFMIDIG